MDISKVERQVPIEVRRSDPQNYIRILLQDILCFFILLSLALLIVAAILCVADDVSRLQHRHQDPTNASRGESVEEAPKQGRRYLRPYTWVRFFHCHKQQQQQPQQPLPQQQDGKLIQLPEQERLKIEGQPLKAVDHEYKQLPLGPYQTPTYGPTIHHSEHIRLQAAGGDHVTAPAGNELDSEPVQVL